MTQDEEFQMWLILNGKVQLLFPGNRCLTAFFYPFIFFLDKVFVENVEVARCDKCNGIVKPDIVFFGENLPARFFHCSIKVC